MGSSDIVATLSNMPTPSRASLLKWWESFLVPYYITVAAVLGAITVGFVVITALLILVAANFNILALIE